MDLDQEIISNRTPRDYEGHLMENFRDKQVRFCAIDKIIVSNVESSQSIMSNDSDQQPDRIEEIEVSLDRTMVGFKNQVWKTRALNIIVIVARFVTYILTNSEKFKLRYLELRQFLIIGDISADFDFFVKNNLIRTRQKKKLCDSFKYFVTIFTDFMGFLKLYIKPIRPDNGLKIIWDCVVFVILLLNIIYIPMKICFDLPVIPDILDLLLETMPQFIFIAEITLNFDVAYYSRGVLVLNQLQIAKHYLKGRFILDFIVIMPYLLGRNNSSYIEFILILRVSRVMTIFSNLVEQFNLRLKFAAIVDIVSLLSIFLFASHLIACIWHFIAIQEMSYGIGQQTWIEYIGLDQEEWYVKYLASFYWACITTLTIGYGDIVPKTSVERFFVIFVALCSSIIFGYTISSIGTIFTQISEQKKYQRSKITMLDAFIKKRGLNKDLQIKVKKFFEYWLKIQSDKDAECEQFFNNLPGDLKKEVKIEFYKRIIRSSRLFRQSLNFTDEFITKLCMLVREQSFVPDELQEFIKINRITQEGQKVDRIYFILKGEVEAFIQQKRIIKKFTKDQSINDKFFISQQIAIYSTRAIKFSKLAYIDYNDLQELLDTNEEDKQKYYMVKHQIEFKSKVRFQGCELCFQNHDFNQCPFVFYTPNPVKILLKQQQNSKSHRVYKLRNQDRRISCWNQLKEIKDSVYAFGNSRFFYNDMDHNGEFFMQNGLAKEHFTNQDSQFNSEFKSSVQSLSDQELSVNRGEKRHSSLLKKKKNSYQKNITRISQRNSVSDQQFQQDSSMAVVQLQGMQTQQLRTMIISKQKNKDTTPAIEISQPIDSQSLQGTVQTKQIKQIEIQIAKYIESKDCDIDAHTEMDYYNPIYNFNKVLEDWSNNKSKRKIKNLFGKRKVQLKKSNSYRTLSFQKKFKGSL